MEREDDNWLFLLFDFRENSCRRSFRDRNHNPRNFKTEVRKDLKIKKTHTLLMVNYSRP